MKKFFLLSVVLALFASCNKESIDDQMFGSSDDDFLKSGNKADKIEVCHYSEKDGTWDIISISENAWKAHEKHGDVRLDDQDEDGYVPDNECGYGVMGDEDDNDPCVNPDSPCPGSYNIISGIRLPNSVEGFLGPTCWNNEFYMTAIVITGNELPQNSSNYLIMIGGSEYNMDLFVPASDNAVIAGFLSLPSSQKNTDIEIQVTSDGYIYEFMAEHVFDAPDCP